MRYLIILLFPVLCFGQTRIANVDSLTNEILKRGATHEVYFYRLIDSLEVDFPKLKSKMRDNRAAWIDSVISVNHAGKKRWAKWFKKAALEKRNKLKSLERVGLEIWYSGLSVVLEYHVYEKITKRNLHRLYAQKDSKLVGLKFNTKAQGRNFLLNLRSKYSRFEVR